MLSKRKIITSVSAFAMLLSATSYAQIGPAGRQLDVIGDEVTDSVALSQFGGFVIGTRDIFPIKWDQRCASVEYTFNTAIPANAAFGEVNEISIDDLEPVIQEGLDRWNDNPSSFIEMNITKREDLGLRPRGFDFINEVTFFTPDGFPALASAPSMSLGADATFVAGDDLDGDGDSDVFDPSSPSQNTCQDIDGDGDIEFPAGFYPAGTILDNDVQFGATVFWELDATDGGGADVDAVSTHEFGHSHGLSHAVNNQTSATDGTGTTMFPFISTGEGVSELATREPHPDDLAQSAFIYPEGTGSGLAGIQPGDFPFAIAYTVITGNVSSVINDEIVPRSGANVRIEDFNTGELLTEAYSGRTVVGDIDGDPATDDLFGSFIEAIVDGDYAIPVLRNRNRQITATIQAPDGTPAGPANLTTNVNISNLARPFNFQPEAYSGVTESNREGGNNVRTAIRTGPTGGASNIDFITDDINVVRNAPGEVNFGGVGFNRAAQLLYAERFAASDVVDMLQNNRLTGFGFGGNSFESFTPPVFTSTSLRFGRTLPDGSINFVFAPLDLDTNVVANDDNITRVNLDPARVDLLVPRVTALRESLGLPTLDIYVVVEAVNPVLDRNGTPTTQMTIDSFPTAVDSFFGFNDSPVVSLTDFFGFGLAWNMELYFEPR